MQPSNKETPGLAEARRALKLRAGRPTDADVPKPRPLPGRKVKPIKEQLDFDGNEIGAKDENADGDGDP